MNDMNQWRVLEWCRVDEWLQTLALLTDFFFWQLSRMKLLYKLPNVSVSAVDWGRWIFRKGEVLMYVRSCDGKILTLFEMSCHAWPRWFSLPLDWSVLAPPHGAYGTKTQCPGTFFLCVFTQPEWKLLGEALWFGSRLHPLDKSLSR